MLSSGDTAVDAVAATGEESPVCLDIGSRNIRTDVLPFQHAVTMIDDASGSVQSTTEGETNDSVWKCSQKSLVMDFLSVQVNLGNFECSQNNFK